MPLLCTAFGVAISLVDFAWCGLTSHVAHRRRATLGFREQLRLIIDTNLDNVYSCNDKCVMYYFY
jgi:hypothetical protein